MTSIRGAATALLMLAIFPIATSCSSTNHAAQPSSGSAQATASPTAAQPARPTLTNPKIQPPSQENKYSTSTGRPKVVFDPCTWISDDAIQRAGFDPASRKRLDDLVAEYTFLTCTFSSQQRTLRLNSGNVTWEEDLAKVGSYSESTTVNGRQALLVRDPVTPRGCEIDVRTKVGIVQIAVDLTDRAPRSVAPCDGIQDIASTIEPEIGKDN